MNNTPTNRKTYRPQLSLFHANGKGTGCALVLELIPACGNEEGCVMAKIANQMTIGDRSGPIPVYPRFDWENATRLKLDFNDLCKMLADMSISFAGAAPSSYVEFKNANAKVRRVLIMHGGA